MVKIIDEFGFGEKVCSFIFCDDTIYLIYSKLVGVVDWGQCLCEQCLN